MIKTYTEVEQVSEMVRRHFAAEFDIKSSKRTIVGRAVPYAVPVSVADFLPDGTVSPRYLEEWQHGAFRAAVEPSAAGRTGLRLGHQDMPFDLGKIGRTLSLEERDDGLYGEWEITRGDPEDQVLEAVASGKLQGLSVGARVPADGTVLRGGVRVRVRAMLDHVALVVEAAFPSAAVTALRESAPMDLESMIRQRADLDALIAQMQQGVEEPAGEVAGAPRRAELSAWLRQRAGAA